MTPIAVRLRELREAKGLTQVELAELTGIDQAAISRIENQQTTAMDFGVLDRFCVALGCEPGELLERVKTRRSGRRTKRGPGAPESR